MSEETSTDSSEGWEDCIPDEERVHHEILFYSQGPVDGYMTGERARDLFLHSRLPITVLSKIWNLADVSNDNVLSVEEFVLAMHLILRIKDGLPLPKSLPKHLVPKVVPAAELADLTKQEKEAYQNVFNKITQEEIDAIQGRKLLMESQLSVEELSRIWDLSDVNRNGMIDKEEWLVICHLIRALKQGVSLQGPVNVFQFIPSVSPDSYQARKQRVEEYNRQKNRLMTAKEKRKSQIANETRRLELLKKRFSLHKELFEASKNSSDISIPEEEFLIYKEKEEHNIEKVEEIVFRLKKEHEKIRQETVKVILNEQGSLQEDARLIKLEQEEVRHRLATRHTKATKDPDPFHQLYELRKELRKRSTLSEGEEPEIHFPFQTSPFEEQSLVTPICGRTIFISPDPSVFNNNNSFKGEEILKELYNFGEGFLERWSSSASSYQLEEDYDSIFMSLNVPMEARVWSGVGWSEGSPGQKLQDLHQKLVDLKMDMQKLNDEAGGQLLFRNPEDYLARRKAKEEEEKLEKSKHRRFSDRRSENSDKDPAKRRSYAANADEEAKKISREYRAKRRSLNLDKKSDNSDRSLKVTGLDQPKAPSRPRRKVSLEKKETEELTIKTDNLDKSIPARATSPKGPAPLSPRQSQSPEPAPLSPRQSQSWEPAPLSPRQSQSPEPTSPLSSTSSPPRTSTKRKAAPPPPCSNITVTPPPSCPTKIPLPVAEAQVQPSRPPRRKRRESDEKKPVVEIKQEQESRTVEESVYVNVDNKVVLDTKQDNKVDEIVNETTDIVNETTDIKIETVHIDIDIDKTDLPKSNIDEYIVDTETTKSNEIEESLLDTILKDIPSLKTDQKLEEQSDSTVIDTNIKSDSDYVDKNIEDIIVPDKKNDIECEITPIIIQSNRGKYQPPESVKIEFQEVEQTAVLNDSDSDNDVVIVNQQEFGNENLTDDVDVIDGYLDLVKAAAFKRSDDLDNTFQKLISFPDTGKIKDTKDTISIKSDISDASSEAPPLPDSAPPPLPLLEEISLTKVPSQTEIPDIVAEKSEPVCTEREVSEIFEAKLTEIEMATAVGDPRISATHELPSPDEPLSPRSFEHPGSPIADLPASIFSMRVKSPVRDEDVRSPTRDIGGEITHMGKLEVDVTEQRRHVTSDSDLSDNEEPAEGIFAPGVTANKSVPMETTVDEGNIQLISYSTKLHSPNSDNSGPDSAFEDMQSSLTSNDPLSNTIEEFGQEDFVSPEKVAVAESTPKRSSIEDITKEARKFKLALDGANRNRDGDVRSPTGPKDFMAKAQHFAEVVQKPPKMTVRKKRDIQSADDLTDEKCLEMEAERRKVISSSTVRKRDVDMSQFSQETDTDNQVSQSADPENSIEEWRSDVSKRSSIVWDEKPDKVNLYSENVIQETEGTEDISRESIANLNTTRKQWETITKPKEETTPQKPKQTQVRHWEVKLPTQLKRVPAKPEPKREDSDSDSESDDKMADTENANESAIEREIRLAMEREDMLRKEHEERAELQVRQDASQLKTLNKEPFESESVELNNNKPTYHEMTEADRGSELQQREEQIQLELFEQEERELELQLKPDTNGFEESDHSSTEDENANESIIEREIRIQQEREMELEQRRKELENLSKPSKEPSSSEPVNSEQVVEDIIIVESNEPVRCSPTPVSTPDDLSDLETPSSSSSPPPSEVRTRISYEEAIANSHHEGESRIARELREAREREDELHEQRLRLSGNFQQLKSPPPEQQPVSQTVNAEASKSVVAETVKVVNAETHKPTYQKDVSPYKQGRRSSQDSLSSHSTEKSPVPSYVNPKGVRVTGFSSEHLQMPNKTPEIKTEKKKKAKKSETPIEREIRLARERENEYKAQKGLPLLPDQKKEESSSEEEEEKEEKPTITAASYFRSPSNPNANLNSMRKLASNRLQHEIKAQSDLEKKYLAEGKIKSTSEEHVGLVKYTENISPQETTTTPKRNFSIQRKSVHEPVKKTPEQNGSADQVDSPKTPNVVSDAPKYKRTVSGSGALTFSYRESKHKAESKIEQELREMREREEELRSQREGGGIVSPRDAESQESMMNTSVLNKRSHFEQTS